MDIIRTPEKKPFRYLKSIITVVTVIALLIIVRKNYSSDQFGMSKEDIIIAEVKQGDFTVKVRAPGVLTPKDIRWISSSVSGRAEKVWVKPGAQVKAGDLLFELSNPELKRSLEEMRWELEAQTSETQAETINLEAQLLDQKAAVFNAKLNFDSTTLQLKAETSLLNNGAQVISAISHETTKLEHQQMLQRWQMQQQRANKMAQQVAAQKIALNARLEKMRKILQSIEEQVDSLKVTASIDSVVQEVAIELGQQVSTGNNLAKLAKQKDLIAELQIPEMLIKEVALGQSVVIDTRSNQIAGKVIRIAPAVYDNAVHVDVELIGALPNDARPDLSIDAEITVAEISNSLYVQRPNFAQSHRELSIFKVNEAGTTALRTTISLGQGSVREIEVKGGLALGERIIVSEHDELSGFNQVTIY